MAKNFTRSHTGVYIDTITKEPTVNIAGTINSGGFAIGVYDYIAVNTTSSTTADVYVFKSGGVSGTTVATLTLTYSDANTKNVLISVAKT